MIRTFLAPDLQAASQHNVRIKEIAREFKSYKESGAPGTVFGRDADFARPADAVLEELQHLHLLTGSPVRTVRLKPQYNRTSDTFLIYCPGQTTKTDFLLIDIIWTDAHNKVNNIDVMNRYAEIAARFRRVR